MSARDRLSKYEPHHNCPNMKLRALVTRNGTKQFALYCLEGQYPKRGSFIVQHLVREYLDELHMHLDDLPVLIDNSCENCGGNGCSWCVGDPCVRCGSHEHIEWHHWAPRHLFDDAEMWPTALLCRKCHQHWHQVVTPNMHLRRAG